MTSINDMQCEQSQHTTTTHNHDIQSQHITIYIQNNEHISDRQLKHKHTDRILAWSEVHMAVMVEHGLGMEVEDNQH